MNRSILAMSALLGVLAASPGRADVLVGTADTGSAFPFGANAYLGGYYTQQIYRASTFPGAFAITSLTFFQTLYPGTADTGSYRLSLSTTRYDTIADFDVATTIPFADPTYTEVFNGALPAVADGKLDIALTTPFTYLPSAGNLLLTVFNATLASNGTGYFDADNDNPDTNVRFSAYPYNLNQGLVTSFGGTALAAVPETATWAIMVLGFGAVGTTLRRRREFIPG